MKRGSVALSAVFTAAVFAATYVVHVPVPQTQGYINLGDTMVLSAGLLLGPYLGLIAGGVGSALADIAIAPSWAPFTLVIKGLEGLIAGYLSRRNKKLRGLTLSSIVASLEMVAGYFIVEVALYGLGPALVELPGNILQAVVGCIVAIPIAYTIRIRYSPILPVWEACRATHHVIESRESP